MAKNNYIAKRDKDRSEYFRTGVQCGRQQIIDILSLVLRDSAYVGKDTFGSTRLLKVLNGISKELDNYMVAWQKSDEADYYQEKLDANLREAYGKDLDYIFKKRYDYLYQYNYNTGKWK